jgi:hypothetical protein
VGFTGEQSTTLWQGDQSSLGPQEQAGRGFDLSCRTIPPVNTLGPLA